MKNVTLQNVHVPGKMKNVTKRTCTG
ncbi:hypothetical protein TRIP_D120059 [uncultured Paludibacter sp.]|nr:hypothetical protein TRIP_D120059 [uncultured Paludibacter sp.]